MSKLKDLLIHVLVETTKAKRKYKGRRKHIVSNRIIEKGEKWLRVKVGRFQSSVYCRKYRRYNAVVGKGKNWKYFNNVLIKPSNLSTSRLHDFFEFSGC